MICLIPEVGWGGGVGGGWQLTEVNKKGERKEEGIICMILEVE